MVFFLQLAAVLPSNNIFSTYSVLFYRSPIAYMTVRMPNGSILIFSPACSSHLQLHLPNSLLGSTTSLSYCHLELSLSGNKFLFLSPNTASRFLHFLTFPVVVSSIHHGGCKPQNHFWCPLCLDFLTQLVPKSTQFFIFLRSPTQAHHFHSSCYSFSHAVPVAHGPHHFIWKGPQPPGYALCSEIHLIKAYSPHLSLV